MRPWRRVMRLAAVARAAAGMTRKLLHLAVIFAGIAVPMWLMPPREIETHIKEQGRLKEEREAAPRAQPRWSMVICPTWSPCRRDGRPIVGAGP